MAVTAVFLKGIRVVLEYGMLLWLLWFTVTLSRRLFGAVRKQSAAIRRPVESGQQEKAAPENRRGLADISNYSSSSSSSRENSRVSPQLGQTMLPASRVSSSKLMTSPQVH